MPLKSKALTKMGCFAILNILASVSAGKWAYLKDKRILRILPTKEEIRRCAFQYSIHS